MHILREALSGAELARRAALQQQQDAKSDAHDDKPVVNTTNIFLDGIGEPVDMINEKGHRAGLQGTSFRDRILPPSRLPPKSSAVRTSASSSKLKRPQLVLTNRSSSDNLVAVVADDDDRLSSARSAGLESTCTVDSSTKFTASFAGGSHTTQSTFPQSSGVTAVVARGGGGDEEEDNSSDRIDRFFQRMRQDLRDMKRLDLTELSRRYTVESEQRAKAFASASTSAQLNPLVRTEIRKRATTNEVFKSLQHPVLRDAVRLNAKMYLDAREKKYHQNVIQLSEPALDLLTAVWDQHRVSQTDRSNFAEVHLAGGGGDIRAYDAIARELLRYRVEVSGVEIELVRQVALRESHIEELKRILKDAPPFTGETDWSPQAGPRKVRSDGSLVTPSQHDFPRESAFVMAVLHSICLLRFTACNIIDLVCRKRGTFVDTSSAPLSASTMDLVEKLQKPTDSSGVTQQQQPQRGGGGGVVTRKEKDGIASMRSDTDPSFVFLWEGSNYIVRMQHDLDFLHASPLRKILETEYELQSNPLLLPRELHRVCGERVESVKRHEILLKHAVDPLSLRPVSRSNNHSIADYSLSSSNTSSTTIDAGGRLSAPLVPGRTPSPAPHPFGSGGSRPVSRSSASSTPNALLLLNKRSTNIICIPVGEEIIVPKKDNEVDASRPFMSSNALERERYFAALKKQELLRTQRIPMDRSNVYNYPASVYHAPPASPWISLGIRLRRSLDPRIASKPYNDVLEYECLQFGRITVPPSSTHPYHDPIIDEANNCIRSVLQEIPNWSYDDLMRREILIFSEETVVLRASSHRKLSRGLARFKMAYRGFVSVQKRRQLIAATTDSRISAREFVEWVSQHAPSWKDEAREALLGRSGDDGAEDDGDAVVGLLAL